MRLGWGSGRKGAGGASAFCRAIITAVQCLSFIICNDPACLSPLPPQSTLDYQGRFVLAYPTFLLTMQAGRQAPTAVPHRPTPDSWGVLRHPHEWRCRVLQPCSHEHKAAQLGQMIRMIADRLLIFYHFYIHTVAPCTDGTM